MSYLKRFHFRDGNDPFFAFLILTFPLLGLLVLYPASSVVSQIHEGDPAFYVKKQAVWFVVGVIGLLFCATVSLRLVKRVAPFILLANLVLLLLVFVPGIGQSVASANESFNRWISLFGFTFQPSEFAKISIILYLSSVLSRSALFESSVSSKGKYLFPSLLIGIFLLVIVMEPQYGTTICILLVIVTMIYIAGFPFLRLALLFASIVPLLVVFAVMWEYRLNRLKVWLDPYAYRYEGGYQLVTSFRAFREGGWFGEELASGFAHKYLTYGHTDFVLALFAENYGLIGVAALIGAFLLFVWKSYSVIKKIEEPFPFLVAAGSVVMIITQTLLNMGVVTGIVPTTGVSLPFFSYGGSSLVTTMCFCGLILNASRWSGESGEKQQL